MVQEAAIRTYKAVICRRCRAPIPVPGIVIRMEESAEVEDTPSGKSERVFSLRCRACEAEGQYRSSQIAEVEGEPKGRRMSPKAWLGQGPLTRAAGA
jgi:RNase P subunit RPR2